MPHVQRRIRSATARRLGAGALGLSLLAALSLPSAQTLAISAADDGPSIAPILKRDVLVGADMWDTKPRLMSLTLNFEGIIGIPNADNSDFDIARAAVEAAGGAWNVIIDCSITPTQISHTTAVSPEQYYSVTGVHGEFLDVVQVQTSWPV